jgi:hypothetical protein
MQILGMMSELGLNDSHDPYTDSSSSNTARYTAAGANVATVAASAGGAYEGNNSSSNTNYQFAGMRGSSSSNNTDSSWAPSVLHELTLSTSEGPNSNESVEVAQYVSTHLIV